MAIITFVRHGQTEWNRIERVQGKTNNPLNNTGKDQAALAADKLRDTEWHVIYSSPLVRALQTAQIVCDELDIEERIHTEEGFEERAFGILEGGNYQNFRNVMDNKLDADGLETEAAIMARVSDAANKIVDRYPNKNILVFCHSHTMKAFLTYVDPEQFNFRTQLENLQACSFTRDADGIWQFVAMY